MRLPQQIALLSLGIAGVLAYDMVPRWGHAAIYIPSPPSLLIHGGKTSSPEHTYSSSPNSGDLIRLPLDSSFNASSPPYELITASPSPAYAWHTLSYLNSSEQVLVFGGDGGPGTPLPAGTDSAWLLSPPGSGGAPAVAFSQQTSTWANQPPRRILHSAVSASDGTTYITGGQKNDGSGTILSDAYTFNSSTSIFTPLPSLPRGTAHDTSALLSNGTLVVLGGIYTSPDTGNPTLADLTRIYSLDTRSASPVWNEVLMAGAPPAARRGATGTLMADDKLYILGGTGMSSSSAMGDMWVLDLKAGVWSQVNSFGTGPTPRFDHTASNVGNGQILVFGGYGADGAVSPETYIFDTTSNSWTNTFTAITASPSPSASLSAAGTMASATNSGNPNPGQNQSSGSSIPPAFSTPAYASQTQSGVSASGSATDSSSPPPAAPGLSKGAQVGLAVGVTMSLAVMAMMIVLLIRRRRAGLGGSEDEGGSSPGGWFSPRPPPIEKDGQRLLGEKNLIACPTEWSEKGGFIGLGFGAVGAGFLALQSGQREREYQQIGDDGHENTGGVAPPARKSTRRAGQGIRLLGPRQNPTATVPPMPQSPPRVNMLHDEDSRSFALPRIVETDWTVDRKGREGWRTADSVLAHQHDIEPSDPFEDSLPLIRGGPVPTPHASRSEFDPFDDRQEEVDIGTAASRGGSGPGLYQLPPLASSDPLDIAGLLAPSHGGDGNGSLPRSNHSRGSTYFSSSDTEEGIVNHAQFASQSQAVYSPQEEEYQPIKRTESFFRRMTAGGLSSLIGANVRRNSVAVRRESLDIRDPAPGPSLWPVVSRHDLEASGSEDPHAESSYARLSEPVRSHTKGPSLSSLSSARSMRNMVIVKREGTDSTEGSMVVVEQTDSPVPDSWMGSPELVLDGPSPIVTQGTSGTIDRQLFASPTEGLSPVTPLDISTSSTNTSSSHSTQPMKLPDIITESPASGVSHSSRSSIPQPPSGSPLPKHLVEHRRPVKDMVISINKRASRTFPLVVPESNGPLSPTSQYSVTPGATPLVGQSGGMEGRGISWEVRRRESLVVANPDKRKGQ